MPPRSGPPPIDGGQWTFQCLAVSEHCHPVRREYMPVLFKGLNKHPADCLPEAVVWLVVYQEEAVHPAQVASAFISREHIEEYSCIILSLHMRPGVFWIVVVPRKGI